MSYVSEIPHKVFCKLELDIRKRPRTTVFCIQMVSEVVTYNLSKEHIFSNIY